jgi:hypothetical protein
VVTARASHVRDDAVMHRAMLALALVAAAGCGAGSDAVRPQRAPAPKAVHGLYRAAGARLLMDCRGAGARTVVLDAGLGVESNAAWAAVRPAVARYRDSPGRQRVGCCLCNELGPSHPTRRSAKAASSARRAASPTG